jgi:hypothetical protein
LLELLFIANETIIAADIIEIDKNKSIVSWLPSLVLGVICEIMSSSEGVVPLTPPPPELPPPAAVDV